MGVVYKYKKEGSGKCFVYFLATFVIICALVLVFASLLRVRNLNLKLRSAISNKITYNDSPSFNATLLVFLTINNPNFGAFTYRNNSLSVFYAGVKIAHTKIRANTVSSRHARQIHVTVNLRSAKVPFSRTFSNDINSGSFKLTTNIKFSGTVYLLKIIKVRKTAQTACSMNLNFASHAIQAIQCQ